MANSNEDIGLNRFYSKLLMLQSKVIESQSDVMKRVAEEMAFAIINEGRIFIFGTGHSHMIAEEAFYRAGGIAAVVPIFMNGLMLHENADLSGRLERTPGIAESLLDQYDHNPGDMIFVVSNSGVNQMPVEMALAARERHLLVVAICSKKYAKVAPISSIGKRLDEVVDFCIDNCGIPGDALVEIEGTPWRIGSTSTIIGAMIWNCLLTEVIDHLTTLDKIPVFASFNMEGAAAHNQLILKTWSKRNPHIWNR
jgi:uncharacterized phosphosugar-binding protein